MKIFLRSRDVASKGAALMIVLALVVLLTGLALAYFSRAGTDRQLAQSSYNDTSADLLARSALDIIVGDFKQEIVSNPTVTYANIQPARYGDASIPNLIRRSFSGDPTNRTSSVSSSAVSANGRSISTTRWNSHYLIPRGNTGPAIDSSPVPSFTPPDWVLVTGQGPSPAPTPGAVIGRYAFAVYDEGGLLDMNVAGYPTWAGTVPSSPSPSPTPWLVNVGRKGILAFADLTAFPTATPATTPTWIDKIVGWRNYAMTQQPTTTFSHSGVLLAEPQHQAEFLWQLLALFRRSAIPNRQPVGQAACFNLSVHFRWELHLPGPGTRCQLADRSGFHDSAATFEAAPQRYP